MSQAEQVWVVLVIRANFAGRVCRSLSHRSIEFFAPQTLSAAGHKVRLFPTYVFALLWAFWDVSGVRHVYRTIFLNRDDLARLTALRERAEDNVIPSAPIVAPLRRGNPIIIRAGPFEGQIGLFDGITHNRARIILDFMQKETAVEVPMHHIKRD